MSAQVMDLPNGQFHGSENNETSFEDAKNFWVDREQTATKPVDQSRQDGDNKLSFNPSYICNPESDSDSEDDDQIIFQDLQLFFHAMNEPQLAENFIKHRVTLGQLLLFEEQDLINCGIDLVGDRKKILASTGKVHGEKWVPSSLHDLTQETLLTSPGIYVTLNDVNKHLEYIGITFKYLRRRIQSVPSILELGKDYVGVGKISTEIKDLLVTSASMHSQLKALDRKIKDYTKDPTLQPANHIDKYYIKKAKFSMFVNKYGSSLLLATAVVGISIKLYTVFH